jgi:2-polyprenyl-3-methyl-5-hydroxy-6-metoxy-1,4-benzoquinol methylase
MNHADNDKVKVVWNANAEFWDSKMGEGNVFHKTLIEPVQLKLLNIKPGERILDLACGNGQFARKMAEQGAEVTAVDFSERFISIAKSKSPLQIEYQISDLTDKNDLDRLPKNCYDAVVCTMALMDMENIDVIFSYLPKLLKKTGCFVFSILHPCFNSGEVVLMHENDDSGGQVKNRYSVKISNYLTEQCNLGVGMIGQPQPQFYFHRPVSTILRRLFECGFVLDAFEEPSFSTLEGSLRIYDNVFRNVPPALICRLRLLEQRQV